MITGDLRNKIDKLWEEFWTGGIANPLQVIEQITFLLFARMLDMTESRNEKRAARTGRPLANPIFSKADQELRWSQFKNLAAPLLLPLVRDRVFPHFKELGGQGSRFAEYMKDAQLMVQKPSLLVSAVNMIDALPLERTDIKGDLYEYLLSKLSQAGVNGQFRTPRHIIRFMVEVLDPKADETIGDPACGTAGFLVSAAEYLLEKYTSPGGVVVDEGQRIFSGDLLSEKDRAHRQRGMFHGFDFDVTMLRIAAMNLVLHGIEEPDIHYQDTLSTTFPERFRKQSQDAFDLVLANPPFKGSLDYSDVQPALLARVKTKKTELLFIALILRMLRLGGRCAMIVPDGVLFGSSNAHQALRKMLIEENQLDAVISLPSGVFKPYAGVSTAILVFTRGGKTNEVFFYDVEADGFSLDDKRDRVEANDLPDALKRWKSRDPNSNTDRTAKAFFVPAREIAERKYDLSLNRYKETVHTEERHDPPREILARMKGLELEIVKEIEHLEDMLQ
jgi:type I restriction enzyme M protein